MNFSLAGSSAHRIFQARILEWVAIFSSRGSSRPSDRIHVSSIGRWILYPEPTVDNSKHFGDSYRNVGAPLATQTVKNLPVMQETGVQSLVRKIPWRRKWLPSPVFLPRKSHGQRSLAGYSPRGCKRVGHNLATKQQQQEISKDEQKV